MSQKSICGGHAPTLLALVLLACGESTAPAGPPAKLAVLTGDAQTAPVGETLARPLAVRVTDASGRGVAGAVVTFRVTSGGGMVVPPADTADAEGVAESTWTLGTSTTVESRVVAQVAGVTESVVFSATTTAAAPATLQKLTEVGCGLPGVRDVTLRVLDRFENAVPQAKVGWTATGRSLLSGNSTTTDDAGRTTVRWTTAASALGPTLSATVGALTAVFTLRFPNERALAVGQSVTLDGAVAQCNDFAAAGAQYTLTVTNTTPNASNRVSFGLLGSFSTGEASAALRPAEVEAPRQRVAVSSAEARAARAAASAHERVHRGNVALIRELARAPGADLDTHGRAPSSAAPPPAVGDTLAIRMADPFALSCTNVLADIRARVVHSGTHGVLLEDVAAPLAGTMDGTYVALGREFDDVMWPILTTNFGNPLAFDARLDGNERVFMVFSQRVNRTGLAGYVVTTDFHERERCSSSNAGEVFYARVPTSGASGFSGDTREDWLRRVRTVLIHEAKHLVSYALAFARTNGQPGESSLEERWLEESTATMAEELWARRVFGYAQRGNTGYAASIFCEVRPANVDAPQCAGSPRSMYDHFLLLHDYESDIEKLSPLGGSSSDDFTYYGSGWSFLRWAIDHYAVTEATFLRQLTAEAALRGAANLEARTGRPFAELITDWATAIALDDRAGFTPARSQLTMPSWNLPDIFRGLNADFPGGFSAAPLATRRTSFGDFIANVSTLRGGTSAVFEISGSQPGRQLIELRGANGAAVSGALRMTVVRTR